MKISEEQRLATALEMIEEISTHAQSTNPERDWKSSQEAVCRIYKIVHSIRSLMCRKNHPLWLKEIDEEVKKKLRLLEEVF